MSLPIERPSGPRRLPPGSPLWERLWFRSVQTPDGCWLWQGTVNREGYGRLNVAGRTTSVHRASYETYVGPIPEGYQVDHLCRVRACWRPEHLEAVTPLVNTHRAVDQPAVLNLLKTHCHNGHPLEGDNLRVHIRRGRPQRQCVLCKKARDARFEQVRDPMADEARERKNAARRAKRARLRDQAK